MATVRSYPPEPAPDPVPPRRPHKLVRIVRWFWAISTVLTILPLLIAFILLHSAAFHAYLIRTAQQQAQETLGVRVQLQNFALESVESQAGHLRRHRRWRESLFESAPSATAACPGQRAHRFDPRKEVVSEQHSNRSSRHTDLCRQERPLQHPHRRRAAIATATPASLISASATRFSTTAKCFTTISPLL